jgi:microcystin-dependent protein
VPVGTILIWSGSIATIPLGFHLCDGTNGTPDLRSRFVYGAGNGNTKTSWANGWDNVNGHWPVGQVGGEEQHILTIAEMPSHNHDSNPWSVFYRGQKDGIYTDGSPNFQTGAGSLPTSYTGGDQPHNILPRFMTLAYIMKL